MATIHMNLDKIISEKIDAKLTEAVDKIIEKALSNIVIDIDSPDKKNLKNEGDYCNCNKQLMEEDSDKKYAEEVKEEIKEEKNDPFEEFKQGWVEKNNAYIYIINTMKKALTENQIKSIAMPSDMSAKEYAFKTFIDNLTYDQLSDLFRNNKYLNIEIDPMLIHSISLEENGIMAKDIYYILFKEIINNIIHKTIVFNPNYDYDNTLERLIVDEFYRDFDNKCSELANNVINNYHILVFDELFGSDFYMKK